MLLIPWLLVLLVLEISTRVFFDKPAPVKTMFSLTMSRPDTHRVWRYKENNYQEFSADEFRINIRTNDVGLRDNTDTHDADLRILVTGDSFTFGWGVEEADRYSEVLEKLLAGKYPGKKFDILNAGHWMYTFDQQYLLTRELVDTYKPDIVIQGVYVPHIRTIGNHKWITDPEGNVASIGYARPDNVVIVTADGALKRTNRLIENPPLSSRLISKVAQLYYRWKQLHTTPASIMALYDPADESNEYAWELTGRALTSTIELLQQRGIPYMPFLIPNSLAVSEDEWEDWVRKDIRSRHIDLDYPAARLGRLFQSHAAPFINLLPEFRKAYNADLYFDRDSHWTADGHRLAADKLLIHLENLIPVRTGQRHSPGAAVRN